MISLVAFDAQDLNQLSRTLSIQMSMKVRNVYILLNQMSISQGQMAILTLI